MRLLPDWACFIPKQKKLIFSIWERCDLFLGLVLFPITSYLWRENREVGFSHVFDLLYLSFNISSKVIFFLQEKSRAKMTQSFVWVRLHSSCSKKASWSVQLLADETQDCFRAGEGERRKKLKEFKVDSTAVQRLKKRRRRVKPSDMKARLFYWMYWANSMERLKGKWIQLQN